MLWVGEKDRQRKYETCRKLVVDGDNEALLLAFVANKFIVKTT